jgi:DNA invertase Pin-like site-specific DNA recombinase
LVVTKLDRLARSLPDARAIADELTVRQVRLNLGGSVYDPTDPVGRLLFNVLAMVAEFWRGAWPAAAWWCCGSTR